MSKPDDIPQRIWDEIEGLVEAVQDHSIDGKEEIARAILAAEQRCRRALRKRSKVTDEMIKAAEAAWYAARNATYERDPDKYTNAMRAALSAALALRTPSDGVKEAVAVLKSYWMGRYWDGVTDQDRERIDAAFSTLSPGKE